jgi:GT2 family glycosyltransferase
MNSTNAHKNELATSIIIINRNGKEITKNCIDALLPQKFKELIIVDNDSTDGSDQLYKSFNDKRIIIVKNKSNKGYAEANNQGYKKSTGKFVVFLNNDTIPLKDFLRPLLQYLEEHNRVAAVQPIILFPDKTIDSVGSYLTPTGFLYHRAHRQKPTIKNCQPAFVYTLKGACMVWKREVLEHIGIFDESYFAYFEETELCNRALRAGYQLAFVPKTAIIHLGGFTSNSMDQTFIQFFNTKNRIQTYLRHLPDSLFWKIVPLHVLLSELLATYSLLKSFELGMAIQKGVAAGIKYGLEERSKNDILEYPVTKYMKRPDTSYYRALFSSLKGYDKLW